MTGANPVLIIQVNRLRAPLFFELVCRAINGTSAKVEAFCTGKTVILYNGPVQQVVGAETVVLGKCAGKRDFNKAIELECIKSNYHGIYVQKLYKL
jgi:hypothetical protein